MPLDGLGAHALWPTLDGRTAADLAALHTAHAPALTTATNPQETR
ncbi:hypothetical protein SRABI128_02805 [Microbacterium sp. Bi128]|nr:hypothetical protein SRABI128_02805 [Microbacterium sp. Bi128]